MLSKEFSLEKLGGEYSALSTAIGGNLSTAVFYATQNARYLMAVGLKRFFLYVAPDRISATNAKRILEDYAQGEVVFIPERDDVLMHSKVNASYSLSERTCALGKILDGTAVGAVISSEGLNRYYPSKASFYRNMLSLKVGDELDPELIADTLTKGGYNQVEVVTAIGEYSRRGDIIDLWLTDSELPIRMEFFGDEIESIRQFAPDSMLSVKEVERVSIYPRSDILVSQEVAERALKRLYEIKKKSKQKLANTIGECIEMLSVNPSDASLTWLIPFLKKDMDSIFSYLPSDAIIVLDEPKAIDDKLKLFQNAHLSRVKNFIEAGEALPEHANSILNKEDIYGELKKFTLLGFQQITSSNPIFEPKAVFSIKSLPLSRYSTDYSIMVRDVKNALMGGSTVYVYAGSEDTAHTLADLFREADLMGRITEEPDGSNDLYILTAPLSRGFILPTAKVVVIGTEDVVRKTEARKKSQARKRQNFVLPVKGDYVVHEKHGIGLSEGVQRVDTKNGVKDFYVVLYKGGDRLYLPVDQMDNLDKYTGGGTPTINRLGGREFERLKERVKASVKAMAIDLLKLYERRMHVKGHRYQADTIWQKELEESFPHKETDDQLIAIDEIKEDMEKGKVMDRLLCGDVGFGKTEVAIRAIFKTIMDGKQAAFLSPTTILCQQHYNTLISRLNQFGIKVELLSRFVSQDKIRSSLKRIKSGEASVVVATHRLLGKDVEFHDLGLLVLDEEQRFGVEHKEKIKVLKNNVNVLSLSATPIPRTLHMSLTGIRDISTLETPPKNRLPVETYVVEYTDNLLKDAVQKELARGGQVFVLYNRVRGIEKFYNEVCDVLGEDVRVTYAHGQMDDTTLEDRIKAFYDKEYDVLIATTIIENGIDIPDANTLIVIDADNLGLSALYQLRGRVGRSTDLAYAYFTVREGKVLTENATKRLDAIASHTELGSGFKIAMQDLEIRGAGNILGKEQHGNMEKVGYDMFCKLLNESVKELQGKKVENLRDVEINISGDTTLPIEYMPSAESRVRFYKRVATLASAEEERELVEELKDAYGEPPVEVLRLIKIGLIKTLAQKIAVKRIVATEEGMGLFFYDASVYRKEGVFRAISIFSKECVLTPSEPPSIIFDNKGKNVDLRLNLLVQFLIESNSTASEE